MPMMPKTDRTDRVNRFPAPKYAEHALDESYATGVVAWDDLHGIFGKIDKAPVIKLRAGVSKPKKVTKESAKVQIVSADDRIAAAKAKLQETQAKLKAAQAKLDQKIGMEEAPLSLHARLALVAKPIAEKPIEEKPIEEKAVEEKPEESAPLVVEPVKEEPEESAPLVLESKDSKTNEYLPQLLLLIMSVVTQRVLQPADSDMLTMSSWLQFGGLLALMTSVVTRASVEGLREATFERLAAAAALRLAVAACGHSTGGGYFPAGAHDALYLVGDIGSLAAALGMIALMRTTYKSTSVSDLDSCDRSIVAMTCFAFACTIHGDLGDNMVLDIMWMTALCADAIALVPQIIAMLHGCKNMPLLTVVAFIASRATSFAFWFEASSELHLTVAVCVMSMYMMQLLLSCLLATGRFISAKRAVEVNEVMVSRVPIQVGI